MKLSIIIPCYNEEVTIEELLKRVLKVNLGSFQKEIIVVDDLSTDNSVAIVRLLCTKYPEVRLIVRPNNAGKGAAIKRGLEVVTGDLVVFQDADLEYDPEDFRQMVELFRLPQVSVVFGSRRLLFNHKSSGFLYYWGAQSINLATNLLYGVWLSDQFTCYKMMRRGLLMDVKLQSSGFAMDAELVAKLLRFKHRIYEVPITYCPRTILQGKKIRISDGLSWFWQIIKFRFMPRHKW